MQRSIPRCFNLLIKFKKMPNEDPENREKRKREIDALNILRNEENNKHIIRLYYSEIRDQELILILERCDTDLDKIMQNYRFTPEEALCIISQIVIGYRPLFKKNIIHRNLKPQNILFKIEQGEKIFKIAEFEFARLIDQQIMSNCGTLGYVAPQVLMRDPNYTSKADVFSLGIIFYELIYGYVPQQLSKNLQDSQLIIAMKKLETEPIQFPQIQDILELLEKMLKFSEADRIGWNDLFEKELINYGYSCRNKIPAYSTARQDMIQEINQPLEFKSINFDHPMKTDFLTKKEIVSLQFEPFQLIYSFKFNGNVSPRDYYNMIGILHSSALQLLEKTKTQIDVYIYGEIGLKICHDAVGFYILAINQDYQQNDRISDKEIARLYYWTLQIQENIQQQVQLVNYKSTHPLTVDFYLNKINSFPFSSQYHYQNEYIQLLYLIENIFELQLTNFNNGQYIIERIHQNTENFRDMKNYILSRRNRQ